MTIEFTCEQCGAKVVRERDPSKNGPSFLLCDACKRERKLACNRACHAKARANQRSEIRAEANKKVVKKCRRCGRTFVERPMPKRTCSSLSALYSHRYCPSCTWAMKRAARSCDPRYVGVGGHGDILEGVRAVDIRKAGET